MPITRYYSSTAAKTTLSSAIDSSSTSLQLAAASGLPSQYPFVLILEKDTANEEIIDVTGLVGSAYQVTRGVDGSTAKSHSVGATVEHGVSGRDYSDSRTHEASTNAHGVTGDIVGTGGTQTLTGKTLTTATLGSDLAAGGFKITNLATPTSTSDAATKGYIDTSVNSAALSASSAATSASSAATSASSALTSQTSAATSSTSAAASATAAATSASSAATSATSAATSASSALTSQTSAATSATSAAASATAAATSASSALTSQTSAATSATSAAASETAAATSANSASTSATSAATSASSAATSAISAAASQAAVNNTATVATELRQYAAEGSVLNNVPTRISDGEQLLKQAVWWIDAAHSSASSQTIKNLGWGGSALDCTLGSSTSADSNDPQYLPWDGTNYVYTPGVGSNYLSVPDAASLDITGDIDIRAQIACDNWVSGAFANIVSKDGDGANISYSLNMQNNQFRFDWTTNGTTRIIKYSTNFIIANGATKWVRVTLDVDNGASGNDVKFYTSDDGITWTQLGSTITTAGVTSIYAGTQAVGIGGFTSNNYYLAAKVYRAQILNGIDGVPVLDVDTSVIASGAATSFTALTGQTVTINRATSGRKTVCVVNPVWLFGTDDYMEVNNRWLEHAAASENYVYLNGASGNYMSSPDAAALDITGDIDIRCKVAMDDWTPAAMSTLVNKLAAAGNRSYELYVATSGKLGFIWSSTGTGVTTKESTVATGFTDGATKWVRVTHDVDNGASGNDVKFWTSDDGITWTQLGTTVTTAGTTSIYASTAQLEIGTENNTQHAKGKFYRAQVYNGIAGTLVFDADASIITDGTASTFKERSSNAATVTINKSGTGTFASTNSYLYLPGVGGNYASSPDSAALDITGDIDIRAKIALDDWTPSGSSSIIAKLNSPQFSYMLIVDTNGTLKLFWSPDGTSLLSGGSSISTGLADGSIKWIRATRVASTGLIKFFLSDDGINWTQLGTDVTGTSGNIFVGTASLEIGTFANGNTYVSRGKFYRAQVYNGIAGTLVFDANFESSITSNLPSTITEASTNAATVTINYSGTAYRSAGVTQSTYVYPGNPNTFKLSTTDLLGIGATDSFTVFAVMRQWETFPSYTTIIQKIATDGNGGWQLQNWSASGRSIFQLENASGVAIDTRSETGTYSMGQITTLAGVRSATADTIQHFNNAVAAGAAVTDTTTGNIYSPTSLRVAEWYGGYMAMELVAAAIWRRALTSTEITALNTYFQGRIGG